MLVLCPLCWFAGRSSRGHLLRVGFLLAIGLIVALGMSEAAFAQQPQPEPVPVQGMVEPKSMIVEYLLFGVMVGLAIFAVGRSSRRT